MPRTRLLWFSLGFMISVALISHFAWRDLWVDRHAFATHMKQQFDAFDSRVSNLESMLYQNSTLKLKARYHRECSNELLSNRALAFMVA